MHGGMANPWWRGKRSWHSRRMCSLQFCVSGKRPILSGEPPMSGGFSLQKKPAMRTYDVFYVSWMICRLNYRVTVDLTERPWHSCDVIIMIYQQGVGSRMGGGGWGMGNVNRPWLCHDILRINPDLEGIVMIILQACVHNVSNPQTTRGPFYWYDSSEIATWISNYNLFFVRVALSHPFSSFNDGLTHLPLVPHICVSEMGHHWFR